METLDRLDVRILECLQADARMSNLKLSQSVHLSPSATLARVQRLIAAGYILGFEARLNAIKLGAGMLVFVEVSLSATTNNSLDRFAEAIAKVPQIAECHMVAGGFDYLLKIRVKDMKAYRDLASLIWSLPGVRETRTYTVMEEVKVSHRLSLTFPDS